MQKLLKMLVNGNMVILDNVEIISEGEKSFYVFVKFKGVEGKEVCIKDYLPKSKITVEYVCNDKNRKVAKITMPLWLAKSRVRDCNSQKIVCESYDENTVKKLVFVKIEHFILDKNLEALQVKASGLIQKALVDIANNNIKLKERTPFKEAEVYVFRDLDYKYYYFIK